MTLLHAAREAAELVKLPHTVFALPFALISMLAAARGLPSWPVLGLILLAMVGARTAAMAFNRIADHQIDAHNPRTAARALPAGRLRRGFAWTMVIGGAATLVGAAWLLNPLCLALAPLALGWVLAYSYSKRFTALSHLWLGASLGAAPVGAWLAVRGSLTAAPLVLMVAVTAWVAGFDVLYSLQDEAFDRAWGLYSLPARLGAARAIAVARMLHAVAALGFAAFALMVSAGWGLWAGVVAAAALLVWQHSLVAPGRLDRLNTAFFTANGVLSVLMFVLYLLDMIGRA
ncbi:MAG: UbiA-like polyprenyltransferase [Thermoanaerobaculales bacterium]